MIEFYTNKCCIIQDNDVLCANGFILFQDDVDIQQQISDISYNNYNANDQEMLALIEACKYAEIGLRQLDPSTDFYFYTFFDFINCNESSELWEQLQQYINIPTFHFIRILEEDEKSIQRSAIIYNKIEEKLKNSEIGDSNELS